MKKKTFSVSAVSVVYGVHTLIELLKAKRRPLKAIYTTSPEPKNWKSVQQTLPKHIPINHVTRERLTAMAETTDHQGIIGVVGDFPFEKQFFQPTRSPFLVMLDGIQDPRNLGAILRSAYCTNADGIILTKKASAPLNAIALKASAGLAEHMRIYEVSSGAQALQLLTQAGYNLYVAQPERGVNAVSVQFKLPLCLVIGSEGQGVSKSMKDAGTAIMLPQKETTISYNASVAAGILLFMIATQHKKIS